MDEERKKPYQPDQPPFNPFLGLDLGERWGREIGELSQRVSHVEVALAKLDAKVDALEAKFDAKLDKLDAKFDKVDAKFDALNAKVDKIAYAVHRLVWGLFAAILLAIIAQRLI